MFTYFVLGAMSWGAGLVDRQRSGMVNTFFHIEDGNVHTVDGVAEMLGELGENLSEFNPAELMLGSVVLVLGIVRDVVFYIFWPVTTLQALQAPPEIVLLVGGSLVVAFFVGTVRVFRAAA